MKKMKANKMEKKVKTLMMQSDEKQLSNVGVHVYMKCTCVSDCI